MKYGEHGNQSIRVVFRAGHNLQVCSSKDSKVHNIVNDRPESDLDEQSADVDCSDSGARTRESGCKEVSNSTRKRS